MSEHHDNHGQTTAAWTTVLIVFVGFCIGALAVVVLNWWLLAVGCVVVIAGLVVGKVMSMMGMGQPAGFTQEKAEELAEGRRAPEEPKVS